MALNFPDSPFIGQIYSDVTAGFSYVWDGTVWKSYYQSDQTPDGTVTPPKLSPGGPVWNTDGDLNVTGILSAANISVAGTITYEDVTSVDSIGVVTARSGVVVVGGGVSIADGGLRVSGVSTFQNGFNVSGGHAYISANQRIYFGNGEDFAIGYTTIPTTYGFISGLTNLPLKIFADNLELNAQNGENFATFTTNGSASLYYDNVKKFETLGTGVTVTGTTFTNQLSVSGVSTFTGSVNCSSNIDADTVSATSLSATTGNITATSGNIYLSTTNKELGWTTGNGIIRTIGAGSTLYIKGGNPGENMGVFTEGSSVDLYYDGIKKFETLGTGVTVTGTTFTNQLSVSGVSTFNSSVGIGTTNATEKLEIYGTGNTGIKVTGVNGADSTYFNITSVPSNGNVSLEVDSVGSWDTFESLTFNVAGTNFINCIKDPSGNAVSLGNGASSSYSFSGLDVSGNFGINGQTIFDTNRRVTRTLYPSTDNTYDLGGVIGATPYTWRNAYFSGSVGIGTTNATAKLDVQGGDIKVGIDTSTGLILTSPNGTQFRLIIDDSGNLSATAV